MSDYCKYDDLGYKPNKGFVDVRGKSKEWGVSVSVEQGREMEADGIPVMWPYSSCPAWAADIGMAGVWVLFERIWSWPSRAMRK